MNSDVERSREIGFAAHVAKPIDFPRIKTLIAEILTSKARTSKFDAAAPSLGREQKA